MNRCEFMGRFTDTPELKKFKKDDKESQVLNYSLAINRTFKKANGDKGQSTIYLNFETWDSAAGVIAKYFKKGDPILVFAEAKPEKWEKDGVTHYGVKFRTTGFEFLPSNNRYKNESSEDSYSEKVPVGADEDGDSSDIPF
jgi:single-strand DNA-binding protein